MIFPKVFGAVCIGILFGFGGCMTTASNIAVDNVRSEKPWDIWATSQPDWVEPVQPFNVIGNIYFVGSKGLSSFLITTDDGHILIDGGLPQNAALIIDNISTLGFDIRDVKILLNSHAHFDHSGGLAELKQASDAKLYASKPDVPWLESGRYPGSNDVKYSAPPVSVDQILEASDVVQWGGVELTASLTPGHSPGCTSWTMTTVEAGVNYGVLFFCSASVAGNRLIDPPQYEGIVDDYRHTFAIMKDWTPDVFLANHPFFFDMTDKRNKQIAGDRLSFVDRDIFPKFIAAAAQDFDVRLEEQMSAWYKKRETERVD